MSSLIRRTLHSLGKFRATTAISFATLALVLAINTSTFSVVNTLLLRRWSYPEPDRLMSIQAQMGARHTTTFSEQEIREIRESSTAFSELATLTLDTVSCGDPGLPAERVFQVRASHEMFSIFGTSPVVGRPFTREETEQGKNNVVLLGFRYWQQHYGGDPGVIGKTLRINGEPVVIVGVIPTTMENLPLGAGAAPTAALWRPINFTPDERLYRENRFMNLIGRLKGDVSPDAAAAQLSSLAYRQHLEHSKDYSTLRYEVRPLNRSLLDNTGKKVTWMLFGLSGFVLLIGCANLANLKLASLSMESYSLAVQRALGAPTRRLIGDQLMESLVVSVAGGGVGCLLAVVFNRLVERRLHILDQPIAIDAVVLTMNLAAIVVTTFLLTVLPVLFIAKVNPSAALKAQVRGSSESRDQHWIRDALIVAQVTLSVVLLGGAGIMLRGLQTFVQRDAGWEVGRVLTATLPMPPSRFDTSEKVLGYIHKVEAQLETTPGIEKVALASSLPLQTYSSSRPVATEAQMDRPISQQTQAFHVMVTSDFFAVMGIKFVEGSTFSPTATDKNHQLVVINASLAHHLWPGESAVGKRIATIESQWTNWQEVIGVVHDVESATDFSPPFTPYQIYRPVAYEPWPWLYVVARSQSPEALVETLTKRLVQIDPDIPPGDVITASRYIRRSHQNITTVADLLSIFAILGLGMAAMGVYGLLSRTVAQRQTEFGIRIALGAPISTIHRMVLWYGMSRVVVGSAIGLGGAYALGTVLRSIMPRMAYPDTLVLLGVALLLLLISIFACWLPASRASRVSPLIAIRGEV